MKPKITIIIPTRERCDTLQYTLKTCISQNYDKLTILISDNYSQDNTKEIVSACSDPRIKYINTGKRISMSENWEFALSQVNGGYLLFLGDDDALLPESIQDLAELIDEQRSEAICWEQAVYTWPSFASDDENNILNVTLKDKVFTYQTKNILPLILQYKIDYKKLPGVYWGIVSCQVIERIKKASGRFFHSMVPDIYSSLAIGFTLKEYLFSEKPYSIAGISKHSTGTAYLTTEDKNFSAASLYLSEDNMPFHQDLILAPSASVLVTECLLQVKDHLRINDIPDIDYKMLLSAMMQEAVIASPENYEQIVSAVLQIAGSKELLDFGKTIVSRYKNAPFIKQKFIKGYNFIKKDLTVDCRLFGITDIFKASDLCFYLIKTQKNYFSFKASLKKTLESGFKKIIKDIYINLIE